VYTPPIIGRPGAQASSGIRLQDAQHVGTIVGMPRMRDLHLANLATENGANERQDCPEFNRPSEQNRCIAGCAANPNPVDPRVASPAPEEVASRKDLFSPPTRMRALWHARMKRKGGDGDGCTESVGAVSFQLPLLKTIGRWRACLR
jgi:hypothetical protein